MMSLRYIFENARQAGKTTQVMIEHFKNRTNYHIELVQKYLDKIIALNDKRLDKKILEEEKTHDQSKFNPPEFEPYIYINWSYHQKDLGKEYNPPEDMKTKMQLATFHHVKNNEHHPDYWDDNSTVESINNKDRDKPPTKMVDATKMPLTYVAVMVADWLAMSDEKNTDPYKWAKENINKRWKFNEEQVKLIYDLFDKLWIRKVEYKGWIISLAKYDRITHSGWGGNAQKDEERLTIRGLCNSPEDLISDLKTMIDAHIKYHLEEEKS